MILLKRIKLNNFLSHVSTEIEFNDEFSLSVEGASGSGKSSLVEAILFCLFNEGRGNSRFLIHKGKESTTVELDLRDGETVYKIIRTVTTKGKHELSVLEKIGDKFIPVMVAGKKNIQEHLEKNIIKCSYLLFINSALYPQDTSESFVSQTANKRKEILLEIIKAESFDEDYKRARDMLKDSKDTLLSSETKRDLIGQGISQDNVLVESLKDVKPKVEKVLLQLDKLNKNKSELTNNFNSLGVIKNKIDNLKSTDKELKEKISVDELRIGELTNKLSEYSSKDLEKMGLAFVNLDIDKQDLENLKVIKDKYDVWQSKKSELLQAVPVRRDFDSEEKNYENQIEELKKKEVMQCPDLKKECPVFGEQKQKQIDFFNGKLEQIENEKNDYMNMMSDYNLKLKAIGEEPKLDFERYRFLLTSVESTTKEKIKFDQEKISIELNIKNINEESNKLFKDILERKDKITLIEEELDSLILQENELVKIESELNKINSEITLLENDKLFLSEQNTRLDDANKRIELKTEEVNVLEKEIKELTNKVEGLKMLKDAFGSTGIQDILIEWSLPKLEDKINEALSKTSDFRITLSTQKDNITDGSAKDGLFITVINDVGEEMEYDNYSGGEKVKIKASISEGLASLSKFGFRLLDELFISLDDESSEKFIEVATNLKEEVSQLLVISHLPAVKDIFEDKIIIVKANGISKIIK